MYEERGHKFEKESEVVYERVWREEIEEMM